MDNEAALANIKAIYEDKCAEINGREYMFTKTVHKNRRKVYAFLTKISGMIQSGDHSFFDWDEFDKIEKLICDMVLFDEMQISKINGHWDRYPEDYILFILMALQVVAYPLLKGVA